MDLNRLRKLAGLDLVNEAAPVTPISIEQLKASIANLEDQLRGIPSDSWSFEQKSKQLEQLEQSLKRREAGNSVKESETVQESAPVDEESFVNKHKEEFKKRYGKRWEAVLYATARKLHNNKEMKESLTESDKIKKGAFHEWLGKPEDEKITQADIEKGLASDDAHVRKMAQYAHNVRECADTLYDNLLEEGEKPHDSDFPKITFLGKEAANTLNLVNAEFHNDTMEYNKSKLGVDVEQDTKKVTPKNVMDHINKRIKELEAAINLYDEKGYDDKSMKSVTLDVLKKFKEHLDKEDIQEFKMAQVYYGTLMSPILDMLPTQLINFLHDGRDEIKKKI